MNYGVEKWTKNGTIIKNKNEKIPQCHSTFHCCFLKCFFRSLLCVGEKTIFIFHEKSFCTNAVVIVSRRQNREAFIHLCLLSNAFWRKKNVQVEVEGCDDPQKLPYTYNPVKFPLPAQLCFITMLLC